MRTPEQIRAEIEQAREEIEASMAALRDEVHGAGEWRRYVRRHPTACFAGAMLLGAFVARATSR
ncbi:MAG: hypothetical protein NVSMB23_25720 [Myxococcales bacterium]